MKELIQKTILASGVLRLMSPGSSAAILMYHSVMAEPAQHADSLGGIIHSQAEFRAQMELLAEEYRPLSLDEVVNQLNAGSAISSRSVVITFDDGYTDNYEVAMPILNQIGIPATFYITVECVEKRKLPWPGRLRFAFRTTKRPAWIDRRRKSWDLRTTGSREQAYLASCDDCCQLAGAAQEDFVTGIENELQSRVPEEWGSLMMNYEQAQGLVQKGHIVGSHTMTHPNMAHLDEGNAEIELAESKRRLETKLKMPVPHFSYPCPALTPHWSERTVALSRAAGYASAVTTNGGIVQSGDNPLSLKRIRPTRTAAGLRWNLECAFAGRAV